VKLGIALRILELLTADDAGFPGLTRGEIRHRLGLPADQEITARIRELRDRDSYGAFDVRVEHVSGKEFRYWLPVSEKPRAIAFLASWRKAA
jgi:hypothetical protein